MEKIKLNNGQIIEIVPVGIDTNFLFKTRKLSFISKLGYAEVESVFNTDNISRIEYYSANDELLKTYTDCVNLKMLSKEFNKEIEDGIFADIYTLELEIQ